jgi:hypothetical protein
MNSVLSLNVVNSLLNSSFKRQMKKEYVNLLKSYIPVFEENNDDETFYRIVLQDSKYHLHAYKKAGKKTKKSKQVYNNCVDFILKHYIFYLKETGKQEADEIQKSFENKTGLTYDREEILKLVSETTSVQQRQKKRKRVVEKVEQINKRIKIDVQPEEEYKGDNTANVILFFNFMFMVIAAVLHFTKLAAFACN